MAAVQVEQADLDNVGTALEALAAVVAQIPTGTLPQANEDALNKGVADVTAAVNAVVAADNPTPPSV